MKSKFKGYRAKQPKYNAPFHVHPIAAYIALTCRAGRDSNKAKAIRLEGERLQSRQYVESAIYAYERGMV